MADISIPALSLVALVGISGSGKSTFAKRHFAETEVLSSDFCRGLVSDDETDMAATADAFDVLYYIAGKRLAAGRLTVVDATNVRSEDRRKLVALAKEHDVIPAAIVLDLPEQICAERDSSRTDRNLGRQILRRQHGQLRRGLKSLSKEGFRYVHILRTPEDVDAASVVRTPLWCDLRRETGPFDAIGDVHGCRAELEELLTALGYVITRDDAGRAVDARHPGGRKAIFLGDLVDRGPDTTGVLRLAMGMVGAGNALAVPGNHEAKLLRALRGRRVQVTHGLRESLDQLGAEPEEFRSRVVSFIDGLISHYVLAGGRLVVSHAGLPERLQGRASGRVRGFCLYGETTGETDEFGLPVRYPWARDYRGTATVLYGHTPVPEPEWINNTLCLDTGCVFGGSLTALRFPERELVSVPSGKVYYEPAKPLFAGREREPDLLEIGDVMGRRVVETRYHGAVGVREENAAAALEVMSRFAIEPASLLYLPPTMSPVAASARPGLLEHPEQAFAAYRADGVAEVICEEKHMGSRAVALVRADGTGAVYTRTGRPFFPSDLTAVLLERLRAAGASAGLFDTASWFLLDAELMPWSAKAQELIRDQYAAVAAAAGAALPPAIAALERAAGNGLDVAGLLDRTKSRARNAVAFADAYRRYCWPTAGISGLKFAPFQLLASEGATFHDRPHAWHLELADRLVAADPALIVPTRRLLVDTTEPAAVDAAVGWWEELTAAGGEGMVVKPAANLLRGRRRLVQPGLKVRGREYLRIIYGPDYTEPSNMERLGTRTLGHKRSLASREYALGLEALERAARGEPLWRVHECVFAILALESEPVDPRL